MKHIDYLKLVSTAKRSSYYARPSEEDDALKNLILFAGIASLALTFGLAVLISYFGIDLERRDVGRALAWTIVPGIYLMVISLFLSGARSIVLAAMAIPCWVVGFLLLAQMLRDGTGQWLMYMPPLGYNLLVAWAAFRQRVLSLG